MMIFSQLNWAPGRGLDWVDLNFECSTVCPILPWLMGIGQKRLMQMGKMVEHPIKVNPTQVHQQMGHSVLTYFHILSLCNVS